MDLQDWMIKVDITIDQAARSFDASIHAVRKWLKKERIPRPAMQKRIKKITRGAVTPSDWIK